MVFDHIFFFLKKQFRQNHFIQTIYILLGARVLKQIKSLVQEIAEILP